MQPHYMGKRMADQIHNSTLIYENVQKLNSGLDRFSPILPYAEHNVDRAEYLDEVIAESDENEEDIEIPIWICGEPRYVSGVNTETTCYDIIRALIDDELTSENYKDVATISHDIGDYVITERWRDVEQILDSDTNILHIWNAWGGMKNEVRFRLKINKNNNEKKCNVATTKIKKNKTEKISLINKLMRKVLKQGEVIQNHLRVLDEKSTEKRHGEKLRKYLKQRYGKKGSQDAYFKHSTPATIGITTSSSFKFTSSENLSTCKCCHNKKNDTHKSTFPRNIFKLKSQPKDEPNSIFDDIIIRTSNNNLQSSDNDDELLLVIENGTDSADSGVQQDGMNKIEDSKPKIVTSSSGSTLDICETPRRKLKTRRNLNSLRRNSYIKKNLFPKTSADKLNGFKRTSISFDQVRLDILEKMREIKELLEHEKSLIHNLELRCAKYKQENELYNSKLGLNFDIEEIQKNLDAYAKDIIMNEQQLYQTKHDVQQKSLILDNLNKILRLENAPTTDKSIISLQYDQNNEVQVQFTDNIYEFCDNNQSIIV